jgi:hypothetical protein
LATVLPLFSNICLLRRRRHTRESGYPVRRGFSLSTGAFEYWVARSNPIKPGDDNLSKFRRHAFIVSPRVAPELCQKSFAL